MQNINPLVIKLILLAIGLVFVWFFVGEAFPSTDETAQLLAIAATGFTAGAIIFP